MIAQQGERLVFLIATGLSDDDGQFAVLGLNVIKRQEIGPRRQDGGLDARRAWPG